MLTKKQLQSIPFAKGTPSFKNQNKEPYQMPYPDITAYQIPITHNLDPFPWDNPDFVPRPLVEGNYIPERDHDLKPEEIEE